MSEKDDERNYDIGAKIKNFFEVHFSFRKKSTSEVKEIKIFGESGIFLVKHDKYEYLVAARHFKSCKLKLSITDLKTKETTVHEI